MKRNVLSDTMKIVEFIFDMDSSENLISIVEIEKQSEREYAIYVESELHSSSIVEKKLNEVLSLLSNVNTAMQQCDKRFVISVSI